MADGDLTTSNDEGSEQLINNRQNGRRRGRSGGLPRSNPSNGMDRNNRIDSRARGNASQLHEKYKVMARDMQLQGDRVMTEYYLQFADHYFRVLNDSRLRYEEARMRDRNLSQENENNEQSMDNRFDNRDNRRPVPYAADNRLRRPRRIGSDERNNGENDYNTNLKNDYNNTPNMRSRRPLDDNNERMEMRERPERSERPDMRERSDIRPEYNERVENWGREPVQAQNPMPVQTAPVPITPVQEEAEPPVRRRGRRPKAVIEAEARAAEAARQAVEIEARKVDEQNDSDNHLSEAIDPPVRRRGRRPKAVIEAEARLEADRLPPAINRDEDSDVEEKPRRRGRRPKAETENITAEA
ncbi:conserved hypothetical protein [Zymomonas mobilis subsp. pomaceae ATCC 29192]|uniref:DUF4167 domain-containing protein n=2 Tax=Zymomonas mobilis TaxID=542 RepID=F8EW65_ZYMMT|nr:conserved hypothetical protein [Zymomonas mobilis subsp. pomaceae ATCC 29192]